MTKKIVLLVPSIILIVILLILSKLRPYPGMELKRLFTFIQRHDNIYSPAEMVSKKIVIITIEDRKSEYIALHHRSLEKYSNKHSYEYIKLDECPYNNSSTYWCKVYAVQELLKTGEYDYVVWLDSDTVIVNDNIPIEYYLSKYGYPDIVFGKVNFYFDIGIYGINAGVFLIRNSPIGVNFIDECINMINNQPGCIVNNKEQGYFSGSCYEEGVMNILIKESRFKRNVFIDMDKTFILNGTLPGESISDSMLFLHSPAVNNSERAEIFKKYV